MIFPKIEMIEKGETYFEVDGGAKTLYDYIYEKMNEWNGAK